MNIALIGMPGTMKTSVGKALSEMTGMRFIDTDEEFEREEGRKISEVFARPFYHRDAHSRNISAPAKRKR